MQDTKTAAEQRLDRLERDVEKLDRLRVLFLTASTLAVIFGISAGAIAYKTWGVWKFVSDGEMKVVIYTAQNGGKLVRVTPQNDDPAIGRNLVADRDPNDGAAEANYFILSAPSRYPSR